MNRSVSTKLTLIIRARFVNQGTVCLNCDFCDALMAMIRQAQPQQVIMAIT